MKSYAYAACERRCGNWSILMGRAATRRLIYPTGQCKNPASPLTNINFHQLQVGFHYKLCAESSNQQTATKHVCERTYNYFVCTLPKAATKTQESLIVILSTVIFSKRRKIKSFWIEPSVSYSIRFNRPGTGHSESCALWDIMRNSQQIIHEQSFRQWCGKLTSWQNDLQTSQFP